MAFNLGFMTYQQIRDIGDEYCAFSLKPKQEYAFRADTVQHLKTLYLFVDNLFSGKNQLTESSLSNKDFSYFNNRTYTIPTQHNVRLDSKVFKLEKERNILFSKCTFEDLFADKILFESASVNAVLCFDI